MSLVVGISEGRVRREKHRKNPWRLTKLELKAIKRVSKKPVDRRALEKVECFLKNTLNAQDTEKTCDYQQSRLVADAPERLRCRQFGQLADELRKSILCNDWTTATALVKAFCCPGLSMYTPVVVRSCLLLLFCHPHSCTQLLQNYIRDTTGYILEEDVDKFIRILLVLRETALAPLTSGRYIRKTTYHKLTMDPEYASL